MKKLLMIVALSTLLTGCGTWGEMTTAQKVAAIQEKAVALCNYLPQAASVTAMLAASNPTVVSVGAVANAICQAVISWTAKQATPNSFSTECPKVNDVCVTGNFVKPKEK